jgi:hypothetical protein
MKFQNIILKNSILRPSFRAQSMKRLFFIFGFLFMGCDYAYIYQGRVGVHDNSESVVTSRICLLSDTSKPIQGADISLFLLREKHSWKESWLVSSLQSDSVGMFHREFIYNTSKVNVAVIVSKQGYLSDTIYCVFKTRDTMNVLIMLKKI